MDYEIRADAKSYSEWSVDENGKLGYLLHEFEGADFMYYKIVNEDGDIIEDDISDYNEAKELLEKYNK